MKIKIAQTIYLTRELKSIKLKKKKVEMSLLAPRLRREIKTARKEILNPCNEVTGLYYKREHISFLAQILSTSNVRYFSYTTRSKKSQETITKEVPYTEIVLSKDGREIECSLICGDDNIQLLESLKKESTLKISGTFIKLPIDFDNLVPIFLITQIERVSSISSYVPHNKTIKNKAKEFIANGELLKQIKKEVIDIIGIKSLTQSPQLNRCINLAILQAISGGAIENSHGKIHSLVIGHPASGKKLISRVIEILNPSFQSISSGKFTIAGIAASTHFKDGVWTSKAGAIILANEGAVSCQDFHNASKGNLDQVMSILAQTMEDGSFKDCTASNQEFVARTAIHLDLNKKTDLTLKKSENYLDDIHNIPLNVLTRIDFITEIEADANRQLKIAGSMYHDLNIPKKNNEERILILKVVIAKLRDEYQTVIIPYDVQTHLERLHEDLFTNNINGVISNELASFQARTVMSAKKLTTVIARINCRSEATTRDADRAFKYIQEKFRVINNIFPDSTSTNRLTGVKPTNREILEWLKSNYNPDKIIVSNIIKDYIETFNSKQTEAAVKRKLYRFLDEYAIKTEHKYFELKMSK